jgi:hypothetical protein
MAKEPIARFDRVSKPGDKIQSFKPNAAMQAQLLEDLRRVGFVLGADGTIDINASLNTIQRK